MDGKTYMDHCNETLAYARQLEIEKAAPDYIENSGMAQLVADQGYALRLVVANGLLAIAEAIKAHSSES